MGLSNLQGRSWTELRQNVLEERAEKALARMQEEG